MPRIELSVEIKRTTEMAVLVDDGDSDLWIPRSLIEEDLEDAETGDIVVITVPAWFAEREGLV
jgi:hypothetical protein